MIKFLPRMSRAALSGLLITCASSGPVLAVVGDGESAEIFDTAYLFQVFGSLLLVFACLFGLAFLLRRFNGLPMSDRKLIQIIGSAKVGSREKIVLLKAGEQELLVGVAAGSVRTLHVFGDGESSQQSLAKPSGDAFAKVLSDSVREVAS